MLRFISAKYFFTKSFNFPQKDTELSFRAGWKVSTMEAEGRNLNAKQANDFLQVRLLTPKLDFSPIEQDKNGIKNLIK
ncbi:CLUMA_CG019731, isoform A [Clunio marinus]|uniref:CLUMA_CG019731, isoform A n=1 Tax=Clunio marinus TaxID=568069 RepID=A0A1J1J4V3_9DIPT|nr:CLUMA_CG019731, isoform A [Clunio marinus]